MTTLSVVTTSNPPATTAAPVYATFAREGWEQRRAIRPLSRPAQLVEVEPSLDWWSEHERRVTQGQVTEAQGLRLSGHHVGVDDHAQKLPGAVLDEGTIGSYRVLSSTSPEGKPAIVLIAVGTSSTIMALSYELSVEELLSLAADVVVVNEDEWIAAGGRMVDCLPPEPGCPLLGED